MTTLWRPGAGGQVGGRAAGTGGRAPGVYQAPPRTRGEAADNCAGTARVTERKYHSPDNDFLSARERVTAGQLCSEHLTARKGHRAAVAVILDDAAWAQPAHGQSCSSTRPAL